MKKILITVEGGLGKHIIFTALTKKLKEKYDEVNVTSPYPDIMEACPFIDNSFQFGQADLSQLVYDDNCDISNSNPYTHPEFIKKKIHILQAWSEQLGIEYEGLKNYKPLIDIDRISPQIKLDTDNIIKQINGKYVLIQLTGGQSPITNGQGNYVEILKRNYPYADELITKLRKKHPKHKILNFSLPNEKSYIDTIRLQAPYVFYFNLMKNADKVFCIDSALQHIAAAIEKKSIVIWGETKPEHFGWDIHKNIVKDKQKGSPYFVAMGPSPLQIEFNTPNEVLK